MSVADIKREASRLTAAERWELATFLYSLESGAVSTEELTRRLDQINAGEFVCLEDSQAEHDRLLAEGR
jgi:hypothetical protein